MAATSSFDDTIRLWDITDPARPGCWTLTGHEGNVKPVAFSPDGRALAPGSDDRDVRIRDLTDPHHAVPVAVLEGHRHFVDALAYRRDGRTLLSGSDDRTARLWDVTDRAHPAHLAHLTNPRGTVKEVRPLAANGTFLTVTARRCGRDSGCATDVGPGSRWAAVHPPACPSNRIALAPPDSSDCFLPGGVRDQ